MDADAKYVFFPCVRTGIPTRLTMSDSASADEPTRADPELHGSLTVPVELTLTGEESTDMVDHRVALACGGADARSNMQWLTAAPAKEKDEWQRAGCALGRLCQELLSVAVYE